MDYSKIRLKNERNSHVTKRLNRLNTWKFFRVLYRDNMWRLMAFSILMLLCLAPIFGVQIWAQLKQTQFKQTLPILNGLGFSTGVWTDVTNYYDKSIASQNVIYGLITVGAAVLLFLTFSGGFAVIRDAFWTGRLSTVGVLKSMGKGIKANWWYALISVIISAFGVFGIFCFYPWAATVMPVWLAIVLTVLLSLVMLLVVCYLCILCSVTVTYQQSFRENLDDSWRLMWLNFFPNIIHLVLALIPVGLYFVCNSGILQSIYFVLMLMFGGMYFPLVWHSHMMRTFALFHPVEKKKKEKEKVVSELPSKGADDGLNSDEQPADSKSAKSRKKSKKTADSLPAGTDSVQQEAEVAEPETVEPDVYDTEDDPYKIEDGVEEGEISDGVSETVAPSSDSDSEEK